jgi:microcystin-dependent protein
MDEFIGVIKMFAGSYAPQGWLFCHGQRLSIAQNSALFAILGTQYGGDGNTYFNLPDLRGRVPMGAGGNWSSGQNLGAEWLKLNQKNMPHFTATATVTQVSGRASGYVTGNAVAKISIPCGSIGATNNPKDQFLTISNATDGNDNAKMFGASTPNSTMSPFNASARQSNYSESRHW